MSAQRAHASKPQLMTYHCLRGLGGCGCCGCCAPALAGGRAALAAAQHGQHVVDGALAADEALEIVSHQCLQRVAPRLRVGLQTRQTGLQLIQRRVLKESAA